MTRLLWNIFTCYKLAAFIGFQFYDKVFIMKKFKSILVIIVITLSICGIIYGIGYIKYKFWRAEHPHAKTWTFFIPSGNR